MWRFRDSERRGLAYKCSTGGPNTITDLQAENTEPWLSYYALTSQVYPRKAVGGYAQIWLAEHPESGNNCLPLFQREPIGEERLWSVKSRILPSAEVTYPDFYSA